MNKLETASNAQFKRYYYTPVGRAETSRATRSRVSLNDLQLLQRLVFVESENFEKANETAKKTSEKNLLVYFIKHLVRISLKRNSFYVTLGISRILHNYGTNDAMEIYNIVIQDPDRVHDDYYYRSRKGVLMKELKARFGELLEVVKVNRGEERFNHQTGAENLSETAKDCLQFFTPWNSSCAIPEKFNPFNDIIAPFHFDKQNPDAEHRIEVNRIHAALHPQCFSRLTDALSLPPPKEKMLDFAANRNSAMSPELSNYRYVHFATHGFINNENPELSGIVFSMIDENGKEQGGFLRVNDIFNLKLPAEMIVLSGCRTGLGKEIKGEGLVGMTRGFMYAGAKRVVVSLWDVNDEGTSELMANFYREMFGGKKLSPASALRQAQIFMLKDKRWQNPYFWATFTLQGEPK